MSGPIKAADGTVSAPGITFGSDLDCGLYRIGANNLGIAVNGAKRLDIATTGLNVIGNITDDGEDALMAAGTEGIFGQTAAPLYWTKLTDINNGTLRVVSGTVGSGGTADFTAVFAARTIAQANLPSVNLANSLSFSVGNATALRVGNFQSTTINNAGTGATNIPLSAGGSTTTINSILDGIVSGTVSLGGSGTPMDFAVKYRDVIRATKDARL